MSQNYDPQDSNKEDYGIKDYYQQGGQVPPPYEMLKAKPEPFANLPPPAGNIFAKWVKVITRPGVLTFASEIPDANWGTTFLSAILYSVAYFIILTASVTLLAGNAVGSVFGLILQSTLYNFIGAIIGLMLGSGLVYLLSKGVGKGSGDFGTQTYLYALFVFPLSILSALLGLIPGVNLIASLAVGIYELFLIYYMVQAAHRLSPESARRVTFLTFLIGVIVVLVLAFAFVALVSSTLLQGII